MSPLRRRLCVVAALALWGAGGSADAELHLQVAELERLLQQQQDLIETQQQRLAALEAEDSTKVGERRLQAVSIHGTDAGGVAYSDWQSVSGAMSMVWVLLCGMLAMFMQAGFAMLEVGLCRSRSMQHILTKHLIHACMGALGFLTVGWALGWAGPYRTSGGRRFKKNIIGLEEFAAMDFYSVPADGLVEPTEKMAQWFFHWALCCVCLAIVGAGTAERVNYFAYALVSLVISAGVYPVLVACVWDGGFLYEINGTGAVDFAGSGVIHICGGSLALVASAFCGPRKGRWTNPDQFAPHSAPLVVLGTLIAWFGWYGLNCGMTRQMKSISDGFVAAQVAMNTTLAAASGGLAAYLVRYAASRGKRCDVFAFCQGILAGIVSISAGASNVTHWAAIAIGAVGGVVYVGASAAVRRVKVDDPVDVVAVHAAAGMWGVLAAPLFNWDFATSRYLAPMGWKCVMDGAGCRSGAWVEVLWANCILACAAFAWSALWGFLIFAPLRLLGLLRPAEEYDPYYPATLDVSDGLTPATTMGQKPTLYAI